MPVGMLMACRNLSKSYGPNLLFEDISLIINEGERIGLIGPNGAGKSTFLKVLTKLEKPDNGLLEHPPAIRTSYLPQEETLDEDATVAGLLRAQYAKDLEDYEAHTKANILCNKLGFEAADQKVGTLSGGWKKRLSIGIRLAQTPDLLLLDEPTNHLDMEGIYWLEQFILNSRQTFVIISHDRYLLETLSTRLVELNPLYEEGYFSVNGKYSDFLEKREDWLETQARQERSLSNAVRREVEWLRRGPKARGTKANFRVREANEMVEDLAKLRARLNKEERVDIDFTSTGRRSKELVVAKNISKTLGDKALFSRLNISLGPGSRLGLVGNNGTGKTTLLRILAKELAPDEGLIKHAPNVQLAYFDQEREKLDKDLSLRRALAPGGDNFIVRGRTWHVVGWAKRFLFTPEQLPLPVSELSGGEQARVLVANLMRLPADVLFLDEPTNDLDIPSIEVLEDSLRTYPGAIVLITHDRHMLDNICDNLVGLHEEGQNEYYASVAQWQEAEEELQEQSSPSKREKRQTDKEQPLITREERKELPKIEKKIAAAEDSLAALQAQLDDPELAAAAEELAQKWQAVQKAQEEIDELYEKWQELQEKLEADEQRLARSRSS